MRFEFATAARILFGPGVVREAGPAARALGQRACVVTGSNPARAAPLLMALDVQGMRYVTFSVGAEPTTDLVRQGVRRAREEGCDLVIAIGGGSVLDGGKAIAALLANEGDPLEFLEVIGQGRALSQPSLPYIAIPTTAGTGTEVTRNAVLASPEHRVKVSLRSPTMLARLALVDPELTHSMPPPVTASTGLDALTQLIEPFTSNRANPMTDAFCREGIVRAARSLRRAYEDGRDAPARADMALASLLGGLALANAGLGAAHGFAGPAGGTFNAPHGALCAALLPSVMAANLRALRARQPGDPVLARYDEVASLLTGKASATAEDGIHWVRELSAALRLPRLADLGMAASDIPGLADKAAVSSSMKANPVTLTPDELQGILEEAL